MSLADALVRHAESNFRCRVGPPRAFFDNEHGPVVYTVMALAAQYGSEPKKHEREWTRERLSAIATDLFSQARDRGATQIVWRLGHRIELEDVHDCELGGDVLRFYTRLAFLDDRNVVVPPPLVHPEGTPIWIVSREALEDGFLARPPAESEASPDLAATVRDDEARGLDRDETKKVAERLISLHGIGEYQLRILTDAFGERNVEEAMILVARSCDSENRRVMIRPTPTMIRSVLEAIHGRPDVGSVYLGSKSIREGKP